MKKSREEIQEELLEAMDLVFRSRLEAFSFSETRICKITEILNTNDGHYRVTPDNNIYYEAYSENTKYRINEQVLVFFPKNAEEKRIILSRYANSQTNSPVAYVSQKEKFVLTENLYSDKMSYNLSINGPIGTTRIATINLGNRQLNPYDTIYLSADFFLPLDNKRMKGGNYGLQLIGYNDIGGVVYANILDSSQMFGNPYAFIFYMQQELLMKCTQKIHTLDIIFYQRQNFTAQESNGLIQPIVADTVSVSVKNVVVQLGYNSDEIENNTIKIQTQDSLEYTAPDKDTPDYKSVSLFWFNKDENNRYLGFNDGVFRENAKRLRGKVTVYEINEETYKYKYKVSGVEQALKTENKLKYSDTNIDIKTDDTVYYTLESEQLNIQLDKVEEEVSYLIEWFATDSTGNLTKLDTSIDAIKISVPCAATVTQVRVTANVWRNGQKYSTPASQELIFTNSSDRVKADLNLQGVKIYIENGNKSRDAYPIYDGISGQLIDSFEGSQNRELYFSWDSVSAEINADFWDGSTIEWIMPTNNTMLRGQTQRSTIHYIYSKYNGEEDEEIEPYSWQSIREGQLSKAPVLEMSQYFQDEDEDGIDDNLNIKIDEPLDKDLTSSHYYFTFTPYDRKLEEAGEELKKYSIIIDISKEQYSEILNESSAEKVFYYRQKKPFPTNGNFFSEKDFEILYEKKSEIRNNLINSSFLYKIQPNYMSSKTNNRIKCIITTPVNESKVDFIDEKTFSFSPMGSAGTNCTIVFLEDENNSDMLFIEVFDENGEKLQDSEIFYRWKDNTKKDENNPWIQYTGESINTMTDRSIETYNVIEAQATINYEQRAIQIYGFYAVPISQDPIEMETKYTYDFIETEETSEPKNETREFSEDFEPNEVCEFQIKCKSKKTIEASLTRSGKIYMPKFIIPGEELDQNSNEIKQIEYYATCSEIKIIYDGQIEVTSLSDKIDYTFFGEQIDYSFITIESIYKVRANRSIINNIPATVYGATVYKTGNNYAIYPGSIIYDNSGTNPSYYQGDWEYYYNGNLMSLDSTNTKRWGLKYFLPGATEDSKIFLGPEDFKEAEYEYDEQNDAYKYTIEREGVWYIKTNKIPAYSSYLIDTTFQFLSSYSIYRFENQKVTFYFKRFANSDEPPKIEQLITKQYTSQQGLPFINYNINDTAFQFFVSPFYVENCGEVSLQVFDIETGFVYYQTPIYIGVNKHSSQRLNDWDGGQVIDEENNIILSAMIGAGRKNIDNTFSGIILGERAKLDELNNNAKEHQIGLFGYHDGIQTYEFDTVGVAKIGTAGAGQIIFDGNGGVIVSGGLFDEKKKPYSFENILASDSELKGIRLDLKEGTLAMQALVKNEVMIEDKGDDDIAAKYNVSTAGLFFNEEGCIFKGGIIKSSNWNGAHANGAITQGSTTGMAIDLSEGTIETSSLTLGTFLSSAEQNKEYHIFNFTSKADDEKSGLSISCNGKDMFLCNNSKILLESRNYGIKYKDEEVRNYKCCKWVSKRHTQNQALNIRNKPKGLAGSTIITAHEFDKGTTYYSPIDEKNNRKLYNSTYTGWVSVYLKNGQPVTKESDLASDENSMQIGYFYIYGTIGVRIAPAYNNTDEHTLVLAEDKNQGGQDGEYNYSNYIRGNKLFFDGEAGGTIQMVKYNNGETGFRDIKYGNDTIIIGNNPFHSEYALQIGKFAITWEGVVNNDIYKDE